MAGRLLTVSWLEPGPRTVKLLFRLGSAACRPMMPLTVAAKLIVMAVSWEAFPSSMAARRDVFPFDSGPTM